MLICNDQEYGMVERVKLKKENSSASLLTESAERLETKRDKLRAVLDPKNRLEELYCDQSLHASHAIERLQRCAPAIINMAMAEALFGILARLGVEPQQAVALGEQWISGDPSTRSEVSMLLQDHGLDESAIEAEAILKCLPTLNALTQLQASQITIRDKGLSGLVFSREALMRSVHSGEADIAVRQPQQILDQRDRKHDN
jgi:hypothetical protein